MKDISHLYKDQERMKADVAHLREWLSKQPHIHGRTDDSFLWRFVRGCKFSLERAKEKIDNYYTLRTALPEFFSNMDPLDPWMNACYSLGILMPLGVDDKGRVIMLGRPGPFDPLKIPVVESAKSHMLTAEVTIEQYSDIVDNGEMVLIIDMKDTTVPQILQLTPAIVKKMFMVMQDAFPIRPKAIHFINLQPTLQFFVTLIRSILKDKLKKRIIVDKSTGTLLEAYPRSILPKDYGGTAETIEEIADKWRQNMIAHRDFLLNDEQYKVDESKRPGKPKTHEELFGFEGSFRQLKVD